MNNDGSGARSEQTKNYAASVRARLLARTRAEKGDFGQVLTRFALERLLWRLSVSSHAERFLLKGAMLFALWMDTPHRPTRDLDLLGAGDPSVDELAGVFRALCAIPAPEDGLVFDAGSVTAAAIREDNLYGGVRVQIAATLGNARIPLQIDVGFGDSVVPAPEPVAYPTLLDLPHLPAPQLRAYRRETVVAEKFEALVTLGLMSSRMKDFYDLFTLAERFDFDGPELARAIRATFVRRGVPLPSPEAPPVGLTEVFAHEGGKRQQWAAFIKRLGTNAPAPLDLTEVVRGIAAFLLPLLPVLQSLQSEPGESSSSTGGSIAPGATGATGATFFWKAGGPWTSKESSKSADEEIRS